MSKFIINNKGVTVVELLLVIAIGGLILGMALSLQNFGLRSFIVGTSQAEIQQNARLIDEIIRREIRNADKIDLTDNGGALNKKMEFDSNNNRFLFGESGSNYVEIEGIENVTFVADENDRIIRFLIEGVRDNFVFSNEVYLNNTYINQEINSSQLFYLPAQSPIN